MSVSTVVNVARETVPGSAAQGRYAGSHSADVFAEQALAEAKREGLVLAIKARWLGLAVIAVMLVVINPRWEVSYYIGLLGLFALIGWVHFRVGKVGQSRSEMVLLFCDLALMTIVTVIPNPWGAVDWPTAMQYRFGAFIYFFVLLSAGTLSYNWRTVVAMGTWTSGLWIAGVVGVLWWPNPHPELAAAASAAFGSDDRLRSVLDPHTIDIGARAQEIVVFMIVAVTLALTVKRSSQLLLRHAAMERERTNLARYFSPNVVDELSQNDEPLKQVRAQNVAVLFVDIVGFTAFSDGREPEEVIETLREFHGLMEHEVFRHNGTLDKYLGDGLMATFGTPAVGARDASNALRCVFAMMEAVNAYNGRRIVAGQPPVRAGFGLHYGAVVLGDIGAHRLEFAVIGHTVNVASRLEGMTRALECALVASDDLVTQVDAEGGTNGNVEVRAGTSTGAGASTAMDDLRGDGVGLVRQAPQTVRGLEHPMVVWTCAG